MYLLPNPAPVNNRKWNLGRLGCGCSPRGISTPPQKRMGLGRLGDDVGVPAGSQLLYRVTFSGTLVGKLLSNLKSLVPSLSSTLSSSWGIKIIGEQDNAGSWTSGPLAMALTVITTTDRGAAQDVQANIDQEISNSGWLPPGLSFSSKIAVISAVAAAVSTTTPAVTYVDPTTGLPIDTPGGLQPAQPGQPSSSFDISSFLSTYGWQIGLGVGAFLLVKEL